MAEIIIKEWIAMCPPYLVNQKGQDMLRVWNNVKTLIEIVKYSTKTFTEPDVRKKEKGKKGTYELYVKALHNIFYAMKGLRIFELFGINLPKNNISNKSGAFIVNQ